MRTQVEDSANRHYANEIIRYGIPLLLLFMLIYFIHSRMALPSDCTGERNGPGIVMLMALFSHVANEFRWSARIGVFLRMLAVGWMVFTILYVVLLWSK